MTIALDSFVSAGADFSSNVNVTVAVANTTQFVIAGYLQREGTDNGGILLNTTAMSVVSTYGNAAATSWFYEVMYGFGDATGNLLIDPYDLGTEKKVMLWGAVYNGVNTVTPLTTVVLATGDSAEATVTINSSADGDLGVNIVYAQGNFSMTTGDGMVARANVSTFNCVYGEKTGVASLTMTYDLAESTAWWSVGFNLNSTNVPAAAGARFSAILLG